MNAECWKLSQSFIPESYVRQACEVSRSRENLIRQLLHHKKVPDDGFDDLTIEMLLLQLSAMDSNNFPSNSGVGEREGRFASELVAKRHYRFSHGVGRSGDLSEPQPKAAGSSLMYNLTNILLQDLIRLMGIQSSVECLLVPVATGMAVVLSLLSLRAKRPHAKYVIWSRIDQKSCFKSILTAGFIPIIVNTLQVGNECRSNVELLEDKIKELGSDKVLCVFSTTSCFAPRISDDIETIAKLCKTLDIPHLINNAYGLQSKLLMKKIQCAFNKGRVDIFVQSTDKNLMVPVGGAIIASFDKTTLQNVAKLYPGRASSSPLIDCFITILSLGKNGYKKLVDERIEMFDYLRQELEVVATTFKEKVLHSHLNPISIGLTLTSIPKEHLTKAGSMLFWRNVSGTRVVTTVEEKTIEGHHFQGWGCHSNGFTEPYLTAAASLGLKKVDVDLFIKRLTKVLLQLINEQDSKG